MLQRIGEAPSGFGPSLGSGVVFYFGPSGDRKSSSIIIDNSLVVSGGAYIRTLFTLDGTKVGIADLPENCVKTVHEMYKLVDLQLKRDN